MIVSSARLLPGLCAAVLPTESWHLVQCRQCMFAIRPTSLRESADFASGEIGIASPGVVRKGGSACLIFSCNAALILRPVGNQFVVVCAAYILKRIFSKRRDLIWDLARQKGLQGVGLTQSRNQSPINVILSIRPKLVACRNSLGSVLIIV
ncbi:hypothetical protein F5B19DRAFT_367154 [Rostrohypoxylon terebratum]|nr:hypothetical protein F5B19DRAFT_367154 [Rostrohypoxylon terebratum]